MIKGAFPTTLADLDLFRAMSDVVSTLSCTALTEKGKAKIQEDSKSVLVKHPIS